MNVHRATGGKDDSEVTRGQAKFFFRIAFAVDKDEPKQDTGRFKEEKPGLFSDLISDELLALEWSGDRSLMATVMTI